MSPETERLIKRDIGYTTEVQACVNCRYQVGLPGSGIPACDLHVSTLGPMFVDLKARCKFWKKADSPCG